MKTTRWTEGTAMAIRGVLAGAYAGRNGARGSQTNLTHVVLVDAEGWETGEKTLCKRVLVERLADVYALDNPLACPTCPECARRAARAS